MISGDEYLPHIAFEAGEKQPGQIPVPAVGI